LADIPFEKVQLTLTKRAELIDQKTNWSDDLSFQEIQTVAKFAEVYKATLGTCFQEGARDAYMCVILEGTCDVLKRDGDNTPKVITTMGPGKTFGEMSLIDGEPRSASVRVTKDAILLVITQDNFNGLVNEVPRFGVKLLLKIARGLSQRLRQVTGRLVDHIETPG
jgi:CRP-like cAMP-binding protein